MVEIIPKEIFAKFVFVIYDLDRKNVSQNEEKATSHEKTLWFGKKTYKNAIQFTRFVLQYLYLGHLIAKTSSTKIYFAVNFFFKVTHVVFLYTVYIFLYAIYILNYIYIIYIIYIIYNIYILYNIL